MTRITNTALALAVTAAFAAPGFAQEKSDRKADRRSENRQADNGPAAQALEKIESQRKEEAQRQGDRQIQVKEKAIWGLGELPPRLMSQACEMLPKDADQASLQVKQAANILELTAAKGKETPEAQALMEQAEQLRTCAMKIETRQVLSAEQVKEPFAQAALAAAKYYQAAAAKGLEANDEEQTGYSLKGASAYLTAAHVFAEKEPSADVSRAAYDANLVATQIVKNSKPTTVTGENRAGGQRGQDNQGQDAQARNDQARNDQGRREDRANIPEGTEQVVANLKQAIEGTTIVARAD